MPRVKVVQLFFAYFYLLSFSLPLPVSISIMDPEGRGGEDAKEGPGSEGKCLWRRPVNWWVVPIAFVGAFSYAMTAAPFQQLVIRLICSKLTGAPPGQLPYFLSFPLLCFFFPFLSFCFLS